MENIIIKQTNNNSKLILNGDEIKIIVNWILICIFNIDLEQHSIADIEYLFWFHTIENSDIFYILFDYYNETMFLQKINDNYVVFSKDRENFHYINKNDLFYAKDNKSFFEIDFDKIFNDNNKLIFIKNDTIKKEQYIEYENGCGWYTENVDADIINIYNINWDIVKTYTIDDLLFDYKFYYEDIELSYDFKDFDGKNLYFIIHAFWNCDPDWCGWYYARWVSKKIDISINLNEFLNI